MESSSILDKAVKEDGNEPCTSTQQAQQERYAQCRRRARDATTVHMEPRALDWNVCTDIGVAATAVELINVSHARLVS